MVKLAQKAEALRALHHGPEILVLPNAWDCASARIFEEAGFPAIATTSAGVAFSLGYPDGQHIPGAEMIEAVRRIAGAARVPVTADLERGYDDIARTAAGLVDAGAVGLNLEDGGGDVAAHVNRISTAHRVGLDMGVDLVINARTDLYLRAIGDPETRFDRACERLRGYIEAGAACVFIPGVTDEQTIGRFVEALRFPINILAVANAPSIRRLHELGVARVSVGSGIARAAMGLIRRIATDLKTRGSYDAMLEGAIPGAEANRMFQKVERE